jgi:hypothetical protein
MTTKFEIGQEVVRTKGDYVVGSTGPVIAIDSDKKRCQVQWGNCKTWVKDDCLELKSIPYEITYTINKYGSRCPKYKKI